MVVLRKVYRHSAGGGSRITSISRGVGRLAAKEYRERVQSASMKGGEASFMNARPELMATDQSVNVSTSASSEIIYIDGEEFKHRLHEAVGAEIEAAVEAVVHEVLEAELGAVQESVAEAVGQALDSSTAKFDLKANLNTLVALTGVVIFERGVWTLWDVVFGDSLISEVASVVVGLFIMLAVRIFDIPLAEWKRPGNISD